MYRPQAIPCTACWMQTTQRSSDRIPHQEQQWHCLWQAVLQLRPYYIPVRQQCTLTDPRYRLRHHRPPLE